jgi:hypothetical protein
MSFESVDIRYSGMLKNDSENEAMASSLALPRRRLGTVIPKGRSSSFGHRPPGGSSR